MYVLCTWPGGNRRTKSLRAQDEETRVIDGVAGGGVPAAETSWHAVKRGKRDIYLPGAGCGTGGSRRPQMNRHAREAGGIPPTNAMVVMMLGTGMGTTARKSMAMEPMQTMARQGPPDATQTQPRPLCGQSGLHVLRTATIVGWWPGSASSREIGVSSAGVGIDGARRLHVPRCTLFVCAVHVPAWTCAYERE